MSDKTETDRPKITFPERSNGEVLNLDDREPQSIVVIGANGSGKTRFGAQLELLNEGRVHRLSAQKSLTMPASVNTIPPDIAKITLQCGTYQEHDDYTKSGVIEFRKQNSRWKNNINTSELNDYATLMILLHSLHADAAILFANNNLKGIKGDFQPTELIKACTIFEEILPHRKLRVEGGAIKVSISPKDDTNADAISPELYNVSEMSDGERVIFYLIGQTLCMPKNSILIIDEPEMHIHKSLVNKLWDALEQERDDCTFVYLTHDIDFAITRQNALKIWMKEYDGKKWNYEEITKTEGIPEEIYFELLGSRQPTLFVEGDYTSIDYQLFSAIYDDYRVVPFGDCKQILNMANAINNLPVDTHRLKVKCLIDRDRRSDKQIAELIENDNVWVLDVAEVENLLLIEEIIKNIALHVDADANKLFDTVKINLLTLFKKEVENQALEHTLHQIRSDLNLITDNKENKKASDVFEKLKIFNNEQKIETIYDENLAKFNQLISNDDYISVLRVFNYKGAIGASKLNTLCGLYNQDAYERILSMLLKKNDEVSLEIKTAIKKYIKPSLTN